MAPPTGKRKAATAAAATPDRTQVQEPAEKRPRVAASSSEPDSGSSESGSGSGEDETGSSSSEESGSGSESSGSSGSSSESSSEESGSTSSGSGSSGSEESSSEESGSDSPSSSSPAGQPYPANSQQQPEAAKTSAKAPATPSSRPVAAVEQSPAAAADSEQQQAVNGTPAAKRRGRKPAKVVTVHAAEESASSGDEQAAQYNLRQRKGAVSYRVAPRPRSPPDRYKKYLRDLRAMGRRADEMSALSDIEEAIAPVRPAPSDDEAARGERAAGGDDLEPILPMNLAELGAERCRRAGYRDPLRARGQNGVAAASFEDVGGLDEHIRSLKEMVVLPLVYPEIYGSFGVRPPRGVLFHGPPGTGKTLLARALAQSCRASDGGQAVAFFMRRGADCLSKWVGDAERQLRTLFEQARAFQPSIVFFDELDGLAPARSARQDQVHTSVVATLLALMDGVDDRGQVVVIGATNRPDAIDSALRRPGRFDREMRFRLPGAEARRRILRIHARGWPNRLSPADEDAAVVRTQGWGGADLGALCTEAVLAAVRRSYPQIYESHEKLLIDPRRIVVGSADMREALALVAPSTARSGAASAVALAPELRPLLGRHEERAVRQLEAALRLGAAALAPVCAHHMGTAVFRPRVAVYGLAGMGVASVAAGVAHAMEARDLPLFVVGAQQMHASNDVSAGAHVARVFGEARRRQPSIVFIPGLGQLAEALGGAAVVLLSQCIQELAPGDRVAIVVAAEAPLAAAAPAPDWPPAAPPATHADRVWRAAVPAFARQWFASAPSACRIGVGVPTTAQREAFFAPTVALADAIARPPDPDSRAPTPPPDLPPVDLPLPDLSPPPATQPAGREATTEDQRRLKHRLAEITKTLRSNRLFSAFAAPPQPGRFRGYYMAVRQPMFLNMVAYKVGACQYATAAEYLADIRLIAKNAEAYARRCAALAAKRGPAAADSDDGDDDDDSATEVADAITQETEAAKRAAMFVAAATRLCDHHLRPSRAPSQAPSEASQPPTPTLASTPPCRAPTPDPGAEATAPRTARWGVATGFNNLSSTPPLPPQRAKRPSARPRPSTGGIPQVVHEDTAPGTTSAGAADHGRTQFLRDLLRLTRGFSADALEALRVRLASELSACTAARSLPSPVFRPLAAVLRLWHADSLRDRSDLGGPSALADSDESPDDW